MLDGAHLQPGVAVEDPGEDHGRQGVAHPVVRRGTAGRRELAEVHGELGARNAAARCPDVQQEREIQVLGGPPQALVDGMTIRPVRQGRDRDEGAHEPQRRTALELPAGLIDLVHVEHGDALETVGIGPAEVGDPVVVRAADGRE